MSDCNLEDNDDITIDDIINVFNEGMEAYKFSQELFGRIDGKIHNEFVYSTRSLISLIDSKERGLPYEKYAFNDAFQSARHILNDSLDLVVSYASNEIHSMKYISKYSSIKDVYSDYSKVSNILKKFELKIPETRKIRGKKRISDYIEMLKSDDYKVLCDFCLSVDDIRSDLKKKKREEKANSYKWFIGILVVVIIGLLKLK